jgi:hypothetical protein
MATEISVSAHIHIVNMTEKVDAMLKNVDSQSKVLYETVRTEKQATMGK